MIERNKYLNQLIDSKCNGFPKVITGIRRCGKSYLLKEIFKITYWNPEWVRSISFSSSSTTTKKDPFLLAKQRAA